MATASENRVEDVPRVRVLCALTGEVIYDCKFYLCKVLKQVKTSFFSFFLHFFFISKNCSEICFFSCPHFEFIFISAFFCTWLEFAIPSSKDLETYFGFDSFKAVRVGISAGIKIERKQVHV